MKSFSHAMTGLTCVLLLSPVAACAGEDTDGLQAQPERYVVWYRNYDSPAIHALLTLVMEQTPEYGAWTFVRSEEMVQGRALRELAHPNSDLVDIANVATSRERETELYAIPVPIDAGLLGLRVCVVVKENLPLFAGIKDLGDLQAREIIIGQGQHWPDTPILREAGLPVATHARFEILFRMLKSDRFQCFARGVSEVLYDLRLQEDPELVIEPELMLAYPMPSYFFVGPDDHTTAQRIQLGLERAIEDGTFSTFLRTYYGEAVRSLDLKNRTLIAIENPFLSMQSREVGQQIMESIYDQLVEPEISD